jgi:hypothetical protein
MNSRASFESNHSISCGLFFDCFHVRFSLSHTFFLPLPAACVLCLVFACICHTYTRIYILTRHPTHTHTHTHTHTLTHAHTPARTPLAWHWHVAGAIDYTKQAIADLLCNKMDLSLLVITKSLVRCGCCVIMTVVMVLINDVGDDDYDNDHDE